MKIVNIFYFAIIFSFKGEKIKILGVLIVNLGFRKKKSYLELKFQKNLVPLLWSCHTSLGVY